MPAQLRAVKGLRERRMGHLLITAPDGVSQTRLLADGGQTVIGRTDDCDICLADGRVSRRHCAIVAAGGGWQVRDLGSANGTILNGRRVSEAPLWSGDTLQVGFSKLIFRREVSADEAAATPIVLAAAPDPEAASGAATEALPVSVPAASPGPARTPPSGTKPARAAAPPARPRRAAPEIEFCSRCAGSVLASDLAIGRAVRLGEEIVCSDCMVGESTQSKPVKGVKPRGANGARRASPAGPARRRQVTEPKHLPPRRAPATKGPRSTSVFMAVPRRRTPARRATVSVAAPARGRVWAAVNLGLSAALLALCAWLMPEALLNFRHMVSPNSVPARSLPAEEVSRGFLTSRLRLVAKLPEGGERGIEVTAGPLAREDYDRLARQAKAVGGTVILDAVSADFGAGRVALRDRLAGIPTLAATLIALAWAAREILLLVRLMRPAGARATFPQPHGEPPTAG